MKKLLTLTLLCSFSAFAECPDFDLLYRSCESTGRQVQSIAVKAKEPFYKFTYINAGGNYRQYVITDGELREVTIQTQDGSEANYNETASCSNGQLIVERTLENSTVTEEVHYTPSAGKLDIHQYANGVLTQQITCYSR